MAECEQVPELRCNAISKLLGLSHKCNRQKCLQKKSRVKLFNLSTQNSSDVAYCLALLHIRKKVIVYNRRVTSRSAAEVESSFGTSKFEICSDMMKIIKKRMTPPQTCPRAAPPRMMNKRDHSSMSLSSTSLSSNRIANISMDESDNSDMDDLKTILSSLDNNNIDDTNDTTLSAQEDLPASSYSGAVGSRATNKRSQTEVFYDIYSSVSDTIETQRRKRVTDLSRVYYNKVCDTSLCHMLCLAGYSSDTTLEKNVDCFTDVIAILSGVKARLLRRTKLTQTIADEMNGRTIDGTGYDADEDELNDLPEDVQLIAVNSDDDSDSGDDSDDEAVATTATTTTTATSATTRTTATTTTPDGTATDNKNRKELEASLIADLSRDSFNRNAKLVNKLTDNTRNKKIRSYHKLTKDLPKVNTFTCTYNPDAPEEEELDSDGEDTRCATDAETVTCNGAYVSMRDCIDLIINKIKSVVDTVDGLTMEEAMDSAFLLGCADGAQHNGLGEEDDGIITYSFTLSSYNLMKLCGIYPSSAKWLLPHLQLRGKENIATMRAVLQFRLKDLCGIKEDIPILHTTYLYDMFDGKAIYTSTGHSHWSRKENSFLFCECKRGDHEFGGVSCKQLSDDEYIAKLESSRTRYERREELSAVREANGKGAYDYNAHKEWCTYFNSGVCHINSMTADYKISQLRPDMFHGRGNVTKLMLRYIRRMMEGNSRNLSVFASYLRNMKHWDGYVVDPWEANDSQGRLKGHHTKEFVKNTTDIVKLLKKLMPGSKVEKLSKCLVAFECMSTILSMVFIDEYESVIGVLRKGNESTQQLADTINSDSTPGEIANTLMEKYAQEAEILYTSGHQTFMTKTDKGDSETFYLHTLYKYVPYFMKLTYQRHRLGVAIFNMEPFEYKNFTSKRVVLHRTNRRGNICKQSLRLLQIYYRTSFHDVEAELKERKKKQARHHYNDDISSSTTNNNNMLLDAPAQPNPVLL